MATLARTRPRPARTRQGRPGAGVGLVIGSNRIELAGVDQVGRLQLDLVEVSHALRHPSPGYRPPLPFGLLRKGSAL